MKKTVRREWTKSDIRVLKSMARKTPVMKIAKALKRTPGATSVKAAKLACRWILAARKQTLYTCGKSWDEDDRDDEAQSCQQQPSTNLRNFAWYCPSNFGR